MKKTKILSGLLIASLTAFASCSSRNQNSSGTSGGYGYTVIGNGLYIGTGTGHVRLVTNQGTSLISPFNTSIYGAVYYSNGDYTEDQLTELDTLFRNRFAYYHALTDRHYYYRYFDDVDAKNDDRSYITNVKVINDSYGKEEAIEVDEYLYDLLYTSYQFSLASEGKFNMFLGTLNDIYEEKISSVGVNESALNTALSYANHFYFSDDFNQEEIESTLSLIPTTVEEIRNAISFDEEKKTVTLHTFTNDEGVTADKLEISLGGNGKGFATEKIADEIESMYPDISLLINSGTSSVKVVGERPDGVSWAIRLTNPLYQEFMYINQNDSNLYNPYEVAIQPSGSFNLSTSGYYEQYFYVYDESQDTYLRRMHIIDPSTGYSASYFDQVSVFLDDCGLADMYTTALMNTTSVDEAYALYNALNETYNQEDSGLILCYKGVSSSDDSLYSYKHSQLSNLSSYNLPKTLLSDGTTYEGDYSDVSSSQFSSSLSSPSRSFKEYYAVSASIYSLVSLISTSDSSITHADNILAQIKGIANV